MIEYVDYVEFLDGEEPAEVRGYSKVEHAPGWVIWRWSDNTLAIPSCRIKEIKTIEEDEYRQ